MELYIHNVLWLENIKKQDNSKEALVREAKERLRKYVNNKDMIKSNIYCCHSFTRTINHDDD